MGPLPKYAKPPYGPVSHGACDLVATWSQKNRIKVKLAWRGAIWFSAAMMHQRPWLEPLSNTDATLADTSTARQPSNFKHLQTFKLQPSSLSIKSRKPSIIRRTLFQKHLERNGLEAPTLQYVWKVPGHRRLGLKDEANCKSRRRTCQLPLSPGVRHMPARSKDSLVGLRE